MIVTFSATLRLVYMKDVFIGVFLSIYDKCIALSMVYSPVILK